ncbi:hypothetical protein B0H10DRAFT_474402 [Mycena sp. CBHHK59/15]|nr:hypothetical protein B0H10DRAFT_474402 [Mycena sp. CBHHK59/15]
MRLVCVNSLLAIFFAFYQYQFQLPYNPTYLLVFWSATGCSLSVVNSQVRHPTVIFNFEIAVPGGHLIPFLSRLCITDPRFLSLHCPMHSTPRVTSLALNNPGIALNYCKRCPQSHSFVSLVGPGDVRLITIERRWRFDFFVLLLV